MKDICLLLLSEGLIFLHLAAWMSGRAVGVEAIERLVIPEKKKEAVRQLRGREGGLLAFTTQAQIIEGHGNRSDR